jgi:membrane-associated protein
MQLILGIVDFILNIDVHLGQIIASYGLLTYLILFAIIFIETGIVFMPFLPGDSLLFAAGAFAALGFLNIYVIVGLLIVAAVLGDTSNYWIGHFFGKKLIANPKVPISEDHLRETERFFEKYGAKTILLARFVPIIRTVAPFMAGISKMHYSTFISYNVIGGAAWVLIATLAGYFFGNIGWVKENFSVFILVIIFISVIPMLIPLTKKLLRRLKKKVV